MIVLSHCGLERDRKIAASVPGIDVIVGGHSHTAIETPCLIGDTVIVQAGWGGMYLGVLDIEYNKKTRKITSCTEKNGLITVTAGLGVPLDPQVAKMIEYYENQIRGEFSRIVGESAVSLTRSFIGESNIGDAICDAIRESTSAQIAFQNSGGIRSDIPTGQITLEQVFIALPFDNQLISMDLTGRQIADVLEENAAGQFGMLQVSGLNIKVNVKAPAGHRIKEIFVAGRKIEPGKYYRVAVNDFLAAGGDGMNSFSRGIHIAYGDNLRDALTKYLEGHSPLNAKVKGRIIIER